MVPYQLQAFLRRLDREDLAVERVLMSSDILKAITYNQFRLLKMYPHEMDNASSLRLPLFPSSKDSAYLDYGQ